MMNGVVPYLAAAYVSQTVSKALGNLIPLDSTRWTALLREWSATGTGVAMAFAARMDILGDIGLDLGVEPIAYVITGLILGHGVQYTINFLNNGPKSGQNSAS